jgi:hypothetical protein
MIGVLSGGMLSRPRPGGHAQVRLQGNHGGNRDGFEAMMPPSISNSCSR